MLLILFCLNAGGIKILFHYIVPSDQYIWIVLQMQVEKQRSQMSKIMVTITVSEVQSNIVPIWL